MNDGLISNAHGQHVLECVMKKLLGVI